MALDPSVSVFFIVVKMELHLNIFCCSSLFSKFHVSSCLLLCRWRFIMGPPTVLKLTAHPWKPMVGRWKLLLGPGLFSKANSLFVSGSISIFMELPQWFRPNFWSSPLTQLKPPLFFFVFLREDSGRLCVFQVCVYPHSCEGKIPYSP